MMHKLRLLMAGESHGKGLTGILEGIPAGLSLSNDDIDRDLQRRQAGYGRGGRMKIERDRAEMLAGVRWGKTIGSPLSVLIENRDWKNWQEGMSPESRHEGSIAPIMRPRPGHADLAGAIKYGQKDARNILERSSARETAMRVALGAITKKFLSEFRIAIRSYVIQIGSLRLETPVSGLQDDDFFLKAEASPVRCPDEDISRKMVLLIDEATQKGDSLGGVFEIIATGVPVGLGSHIQWDKRLDGRLAHAIMGIQAIKGVEIGAGFEMAGRFGSETMDKIFHRPMNTGGKPLNETTGFFRKTNNAGGVEGGITNGMPLIIRAAMKPIPTLRKPLRSVDFVTKETVEATYERSDVCALPAASVIGEAMTALVIADAFLDKFGGDSMEEVKRNFGLYKDYVDTF